MIFALSIEGVEGDYIAYVLEAAVEVVLRDNVSILATEQLLGNQIPKCVGQLGDYKAWPLTTPAGQEPKIELRNAYRILRDKAWACGDGAAYEGAILRRFYNIDVHPKVVQGGHENEYHAILKFPDGRLYDPTKNFMRGSRQLPEWVQQYNRSPVQAPPAVDCGVDGSGNVVCAYPNKPL